MWRRRHAGGELAKRKWDAVVIGGGHNGLTAAAYLARSGLSVAVLERRRVVGGAAVTEELIPGFKFSRCSYLQSLLRPIVIKELELGRHGLKMLKRNPSSFTPCVDGRYLLLGSDKALNDSQISKFSKQDAEAYPRYESQLESFCKFMDPLFDSSPPEKLHEAASFNSRMKDNLQKSVFWANLMQRAVSVGQKELLYESQLESFCKFMDPLFDSSPPEKLQEAASFNSRMKDNLQKSVFWANLMQRAVSVGQKELLLDFTNFQRIWLHYVRFNFIV